MNPRKRAEAMGWDPALMEPVSLHIRMPRGARTILKAQAIRKGKSLSDLIFAMVLEPMLREEFARRLNLPQEQSR